jgi:hypothetical protein
VPGHRERLLTRQLLALVLRVVERDRETIERALRQVGLPPRELSAEEQRLLEQRAEVIIGGR